MTGLVMIAAGGTGGHLFPAAAFAETMLKRGWRIVLMTDARGRRYAEGFPAEKIIDVPAATMSLSNPIAAIPASFKIARGLAAGDRYVKQLKPNLVAGFGGFPSVPALWAARSQKRPILIFQSDAVLGRVNRFFAPSAAAVACGFDRLDRVPKGCEDKKHVTGNPIRPAILAARDKPYPELTAGGRINVFITGGSQGARILGQVIPVAFARLPGELRARLDIVQQVRDEQLEDVRATYDHAAINAEIAPFFNNMGDRLSAAHFVIGRAGASSVTEVQAVGRPSILIPLAIATDDHQTANAEALTHVGAADVIHEEHLTPEMLTPLLERRLSNTHDLTVRAAAARATARIDAADRLADLAISLAR